MTVRTGAILLLLATMLGNPGPARAGVIRGEVRVPPVPSAPQRERNHYAGRASALARPHVHPRGAVRDAVVYVDSLPAEVDVRLPAPAGEPLLVQKEQAFQPRVIAVPAGAAVGFPNMDPIYHSVFSVSPARRFDLGRYGKGKSKRVRFPESGLVNVYCDIHSNMEGFILVTPNRALARPDAAGRYELPDLPPGRYRLLAWHPDLPPVRQEVTVPAEGDVAADVTFAP